VTLQLLADGAAARDWGSEPLDWGASGPKMGHTLL
jgi:hypothetical protein